MKRHWDEIRTAVLILGTVASAATLADEPAATAAPATPTGPSLTDILIASGITETGYVAASYYHSNGYSTDHQFDNKHDSFQIDQAALTIAYHPKQGFGALVNVAAGEDWGKQERICASLHVWSFRCRYSIRSTVVEDPRT